MSFDYAQDGDFCTDRHSALGRFMIRYCHRSQGGGHDAASDWTVEFARWGAVATSRAPSGCPFGNLGAGGLVAVRNGAEGCSQCGEGGTLLSAADDVQGRAAAALVRVVGPGDGGGAVRPDQLSGLRGVVERGRDAGPYDDLALSREARDGWVDRPSARRAVSATRGAGSDGEARDVDRCLDRAERGAPAARGRRQGQPKRSDARFGAGNERRRFTFGYKMHIAVDGGSGLIRRSLLTPANCQEVTVAPQLLLEAGGTVYADRGYDSRSLREELARRGLGDGIMRRGNKHHALPADQVERNHALSLLRRPVEAGFGTLKRGYGFQCLP